MVTFISVLCLTGITRTIDTPSKHPLGNGKIDATRIADPVPRLNGALPISYTQFPSKRKKNACKLLFRPPDASYPPAQLFFSQPLIVFEDRISHRRTIRTSVTLASSTSRENFRNIISLTSALFRNYVFFPMTTWQDARHVLLRDLSL